MKNFISAFLYVLFFFFTHKQLYTGRHFTGASKALGILIKILSFINLILEYAFLIYMAIKISVLQAVILLAVSWAFIFVVNRLLCRIVIKHMQKHGDVSVDKNFFFMMYNRKCDILSTQISLIGILYNAVMIIVFILSNI